MVFDNLLMFLSSGNLTIHSTLPSAGIKIRGTGVKGMAARIVIPGTHTTTKTFAAAVYISEDDSTYTLHSTLTAQTLAALTSAEYYLPIVVPKKKMYVKLEMTPTGAAAADLSLGAVKAGVVLAAYDWARTVDFA